MVKKIFPILLCITLMLCNVGCSKNGKTSIKAFDIEHTTNSLSTVIVAENDAWILEWNKEHYRILLKNKADGTVWSTLPSDLIDPIQNTDGKVKKNAPQMENPLLIEFINPENFEIQVAYGYANCLKNGAYTIEKLKDGMKLTYYFDKQQISVPVVYRLLEDGINISVDPSEITEGDIQLYRITLSPFFCSAANHDNNGYLFVPSGSGAIISPKQWIADAGYTFSYPIYGTDAQLDNSGKNGLTNNLSVKLPVFGAKNGDRAILAVIESGEEAASIEGNIGTKRYGYSSVYAAYSLRGVSVSGSYSEDMIESPISVNYYPLTGENANYTGMANRYKEYLIEKYGIEKNQNEQMVSLELIGATYVDNHFIGIPYKGLFAATTLSDAEEIVVDFVERTRILPSINLRGFGQSGLAAGKIAGNYKIAGALGNKKDLSALMKYCNSKGIDVFMDFNVTHISKSGAGISKMFDCAENTVGQKAYRYYREFSTGKDLNTGENFVARKLLVKAAEKSTDTVSKLNLSGISFASLSTEVHSDYSQRKYYVKGNIANDFSEIASYNKKKGIKLLADNANLYAAVSADLITCTPTVSDGNDLFYSDIPFYAMVFKGYIPMTSNSLNLALNNKAALLSAAESGCGIGYTLIQNYNNDLLTSEDKMFYSSVYSDISDNILNEVASYSEYFESIEGACITGHELISEKLHKTVFDNGIAVYVNYDTRPIQTEMGIVEAESFQYLEEDS